MSERARQLIGTALAAGLNRVVVGSARHADDIVLLEGRSVVLTLEPLQRGVALTLVDGRITVLPDTGVAPDVRISGRARDFMAMARAGQGGSSLAAGRLSISGDVGSAQAWQRLFSGLDDDLELLVAEAIGADTAGRLRAGTARFAAWMQHVGLTTERNMREYLQHEIEVVPVRDEIDAFSAEVRQLRDDVERLAARLRQRRAAAGGSP